MKKFTGWRKLEFGEFAALASKKPACEVELRCVELEHIESMTGKLMGWR